MQVLHLISNRDNSGGTIAALNLHYSLLKAGYQSSVLSTDRLSGKLNGKGYRRFGGITGRIQQGFLSFENYFAKPGFINPTDKIVLQKNLKRFDGIIHIHVTHVAQISFDLLNWISKKNKVFWTLHDLWPLTAKCIHPTYCEKWKEGCYDCPKLNEYPVLRWDNTPYLHQKKQEFIRKHKIHFIAPSQWINDQARFTINNLDAQVSTIPHAIDHTIFKDADRQSIRAEFNLPQKGQIILFPQGRWDDPKKGALWYSAIKNALMLNANTPFYLARIEGNKIDVQEISPFLTEITLPTTSDKAVMAKYYQLADLSVSLSEVETFGLCVAESLASSTPVIARKANGINELLANNSAVLANNVEELIQTILSKNWENINYKPLFEKKYSFEEWAQQHINLYES
ncbi:MAG: glycosyltransferase [Bacteroidota bacterium]